MEATITFSGDRANIQFPTKDISGVFITSQNGKYAWGVGSDGESASIYLTSYYNTY